MAPADGPPPALAHETTPAAAGARASQVRSSSAHAEAAPEGGAASAGKSGIGLVRAFLRTGARRRLAAWLDLLAELLDALSEPGDRVTDFLRDPARTLDQLARDRACAVHDLPGLLAGPARRRLEVRGR